jgi:[ribosomal protein S5]-alanine N-acetyltransferase
MDMNPPRIQTARLDLMAATVEHLRAELASPEQLSALLGAVIPPGWPPGQYDRDAMEFFLARMTEAGAAAAGWYGWYAVQRSAPGHPATLVAAVGYFGPPTDDGTVEIGYSVVPRCRKQGHATEAVEALTARALAIPDVRRVVAEVHEDNAASITVLQRCGFLRVGTGRDPGHHRFERARPGPQAS